MAQRDHFYGKSKRIFSRQQLINPHLYCSVCLDVFEQPTRLSCGHTYCYICIQNCVKSSKKYVCPECKNDFSRRKLEKDLLASRMIDDLDVRCIHPGCKFEGKHSVLKKHQRGCEYRQKKDLKSLQSEQKVVVINQQEEVIQVNKKDYELEIPKVNPTLILEYERQNSEQSVL